MSTGISSRIWFVKNHLPASLRSLGLMSVCLFASFTMSESFVLYCEEKETWQIILNYQEL